MRPKTAKRKKKDRLHRLIATEVKLLHDKMRHAQIHHDKAPELLDDYFGELEDFPELATDVEVVHAVAYIKGIADALNITELELLDAEELT